MVHNAVRVFEVRLAAAGCSLACVFAFEAPHSNDLLNFIAHFFGFKFG